MRNALKTGFTLVELLVTLILLGILVAVVFPVVTQQIDDAEPTKAANDLANIRTAVELFHLNIRPTHAGDLEDLAIEITTGDNGIRGDAFQDPKDLNRWKGPYLDAAVTSTSATEEVIETGYSGGIQNDLVLFDIDVASGGEADDFTTTTSTYPDDGDFVAVRINGLSETEFEAINNLIDGDETDGNSTATDSQNAGKFRYLDPDGDTTRDVAYYLAVPFRDS